MEKTILTKHQVKTLHKAITYYGKPATIYAHIRYDDQCQNGHNSFGITGDIYAKGDRRDNPSTCGCIHEEIIKAFPELLPFIKWHLTSTDGPMHYIANTMYWIKLSKLTGEELMAENKREYGHLGETPKEIMEELLNRARNSAVWPDADMETLWSVAIEQRLLNRLPKLMEEFQTAVESLGFTY